MRILVNASPRTGATTFINWLSKELDLKVINEPFNPNHTNIKELQNSFYTNKHIIAKITGGECFNTSKKEWDFIIGLTRESLDECAESYTKAMLENKSKEEWHTPYIIDETWINKHKPEIDLYKAYILEQNNYIFSNKEIDFYITYEEIYFGNTKIKELELLLNTKFKYTKYLDLSKKYRKITNKKSYLI